MRNIIAARRDSFIRAFLQDDSGVTAIEYGLIAALIAVVIIAAVSLVGNHLGVLFNNVANDLSNS